MGTFDDANVDKDLLNQIFADEGDDAQTDALLNEMLKEVEEEKGEEDTLDLDHIEEPATEAAGDVSDLFGGDDQEEEKEEESQEETKEEEPEQEEIEEEADTSAPEEETAPAQEETQPLAKPAFETNTDNDVVRKEAKEKMDAERVKGTVTTITSGTTIRGGISSDASLEVMGVITGDIECEGKVAILGKVSGNVIASEVYVSTQRLEGGLSSEGDIKIGVGSVIIGDVEGTSAYIAGAVKGDIDVNGHVVVDSTAIIKGNIKAKSIQVNNGAVVDGYCSLNYAGVDLDGFFDEQQ